MKMDEFCKKHKLDFGGSNMEKFLFFASLDKLYIEFTVEQSMEIIKDFFADGNADDIYNELQEMVTETTEKLKNYFDSDEEPKKDFDA